MDLLIDQIEFADVILLNKIDAASPAELDAARKIIKALNPVADLIETRFSRVTLDQVLDTRRFNFAKAQSHPLWYQELYGFADHRLETQQYGICSFVYRARQPFHPQTFYDFLNVSWPGVIRAKGCFWLATRPEWAGELSQAGALSQHQAVGFWWTSVARDQCRMIPSGGSVSTATGIRSMATGGKNWSSSAPLRK